jgi:hypothetical protein
LYSKRDWTQLLYRIYFNVTELDNGRHLSILRARAECRDHWRDGVAAIVKKEHRQWTKRNTAKKEKRAAEKIAYENKKQNEANRRRRTIDQYFR